jgi:hypothetical protein
MPALQATLEIRAYRERPLGKEGARGAGKTHKSAAQSLWEHLCSGKSAGTNAATTAGTIAP